MKSITGDNQKGFTLIELLMVVMIIAILAAIALPNFLEFQTRAKISVIKSNFRTLRTAIEAYTVDEGVPPEDFGVDELRSWKQLTTPIAYVGQVLQSPFADIEQEGLMVYSYWGFMTYALDLAREYNVTYAMTSVGPDNDHDLHNHNFLLPDIIHLRTPDFVNALYDPTNGTISNGDILMTNRRLEN